MTARLPADESARARLRDAQKAEVAALNTLEGAEKVRARAKTAFASAEATVAKAQVELVRTSGADRAALLLDLPVKELRRVMREAEAIRSAPKPTKNDLNTSNAPDPPAN